MIVGAHPEGRSQSGHWIRIWFGYVGVVMKWRFDCYVCGHRYELEHRSIHKDAFRGAKKEGRPVLTCVSCLDEDCETEIVGDMVGNRG